MSGRLAVLLLFVATFYAEFPRSSAANWVKFPNAVTTITYPNTKSVTMRWEWSLSGNELVNQLDIKRYKHGNQDDTEKAVATYYGVDKTKTTDSSYFTFNVEAGTSGVTNGYGELVIKEVTSQGANKDGTTVDVMNANYTYKCELSIAKLQGSAPGAKETILVVYRKPSITVNPERQRISTNREVTLRCTISAGHPQPTISWDIRKTSGQFTSSSGTELKISFKKEEAGVYNCTATNAAGSASAVSVLQYTGCITGCTPDDQIAIEMTSLTYTNEYENSNSQKYEDLKYAIEQECLLLYAKTSKTVYSCEVQRFRKGSVIAILKITFPTGTSDPRKPLQDAISTGTFAGQPVRTSFVSPTNAPTQSTKPTEQTTVDSSSDAPDAGQRATGEDGLSDGAIVAIVVVFSIIFIVIIVVLVVCMLKRKKPTSRNKYQEDGQSKPVSTPLKSEPYRDPAYDNVPDKPKEVVYADLNFQDRYPNGGGPPPQYTAADYAEVRPIQPNQNDSQMEWDKDVDEKNEMWI